MPEASTSKMLAYRDGRRCVPANELLRKLGDAFARLATRYTQDELLTALLHAGELECALSDADSEDATAAVAVTDQLARIACGEEPPSQGAGLACRRRLNSIRHDGELTVSRPEGFAYYALHPLDFADAVSAMRVRASCAHVVGIRSIGTTLSAVVAAKLSADGVPATRTTIRPDGHPYSRQTNFTPEQRRGIKQAFAHGALFLVCDEGPGRSGSSLLSAAEALEREGVGRDRIILLCSHEPDPDALCAPHAAQRWRRYRSLAVGLTRHLPPDAGEYIGGGEWRPFFLGEREAWPATWPHMERLKFLSRDCQRLFKFEGHGPYGEAVRGREQLLSASGFGTPYLGNETGFGIYELVKGEPIDIAKPSPALLSHIAGYCAWRTREFPAVVTQEDVRQLEDMAAQNIEQEFGFAPDVPLDVSRPAICDGRMQAYKWRELGNDRWIKLDASTHGDDHFFPGPTDIAWDLAAVCLEWQLDPASRKWFLSEYHRASGDDPVSRLYQYELAYAAFRLGWSRMAVVSVSGTGDEGRLLPEAVRYRAVLDRLLIANSLSAS